MAELTTEQQPPPGSGEGYTTYALARVRDALTGLRYGEVTVIVQDGVVVQVERTEKLRLQKRAGC